MNKKLDLIILCKGHPNYEEFIVKTIESGLINCQHLISTVRIISRNKLNIPGVDNITDDDCYPIIANSFSKKHLENNNLYENSWYYQQYIKFSLSSLFPDTDYFLIIDCDALLLEEFNPIIESKQNILMGYEYHKNYFITIEELLGIKKQHPYSFISEVIVFQKFILDELKQFIENKHQIPWFEAMDASINKLLKEGKYPVEDGLYLAEPEIYGTFLLHKHPNNINSIITPLHCCVPAPFDWRSKSLMEIKDLFREADSVDMTTWGDQFKRYIGYIQLND